MLSTSLAIATLASEEMLHTRVTNMIVLLYEALIIENEADWPTFNNLKGVGLNMATLPREMPHLL